MLDPVTARSRLLGRWLLSERMFLWWSSPGAVLFDLMVVAGIFWVNPIAVRQSGVGEAGEWASWIMSALAVALIARRRFPAQVTLLALAATAVGFNVPMLTVCLCTMARYTRWEKSWMVAASSSAGLILANYYLNPWLVQKVDDLGPLSLWDMAFMMMSFVVTPGVIGMYLRGRDRAVEDLRERAERLDRERHLLAANALAEERSRLAREMHDVVAHNIGLAVVYTGALEATVSDADPKISELARKIGDTNRRALGELRDVIDVLRRSSGDEESSRGPQPTLRDLPDLVERSRHAGLPVRTTMEGEARGLPGPVERTLYRIAQEALSNVHKHAGFVSTEVVVRFAPNSAGIRIRNGGPARLRARANLPSGGHGLLGMRERVSLLNGEFASGECRDGGYEVSAELPAPETGEVDDTQENAEQTAQGTGGSSEARPNFANSDVSK
ncbi:sensor histidine kinase [Allosaccharopolyspora coralli]|uniref:sensor histidine kinase n=1 Tax=Allosaccharopolyspora coralli TaxID=2665642 RepID=UPI0016523BDE|nr:histidine kinase [Allosaccharopolyspora coralli]